MSITPSAFALAHTEELDRSDFSSIWDYLADIWDWIAVNRDYPNSLWRFWKLWLQALDGYFEIHKFDFSPLSSSYLGGRPDPFPRLVILSEDTRVSNDPLDLEYHSYYVDADIRVLNQLNDSLAKAERYWVRGPLPDGKFSFTTGVHTSERGIIHFNDTTYWEPELVSVEDGKPFIQLWATAWYSKHADEMVERFGECVDYDMARKSEFGTAFDIISLWGAQLLGPILPNLELGVYIHNDWPVAPSTGLVTAINGTHTLTMRVQGSDVTVSNNTGLPFRVEEPAGWRAIVVGDTINIGTMIVQACNMIDIVTDPMMWTKFPIGRPQSYHTFVCAFNGYLPTDTPSGDYEIEWDRVIAFINRNKPIGDKAFYAVLLDAEVDIVYNETSMQTLATPSIALHAGGILGLDVTLGIQNFTHGLLALGTPSIVDSWLSNQTLWLAPGIVDMSGTEGMNGLPEIVMVYTDLGFAI